jgi:hypothetical protein
MAEFSARRVIVGVIAAGALAGGVVAGAVAAVAGSGHGNGTSSSSGESSQVVTVPVVRTDLSTTVQVGGSIGYDGSYSVTALGAGGGVYTWLPEPGEVIKQGQPVYSVGNEPVPLLYGAIPVYRAFGAGMSGGSDVGQLTRDLIALGYGAGLTQSNQYSLATAAAVERWQRARAAGDRRDPAGRGVLRTQPDPGHLGHAIAWRARRGRGRHRADRDEPHPRHHR